MKYTLGVIALAVGIIACTKKEKEVKEKVDDRAEFMELAQSIKADSTIENHELIAYVCENFIDKKHVQETGKLTKENLLELVTISSVNNETLVEIDYNDVANAVFKKDLVILDSSRTNLHSTTITGTRYSSGEISIVDWDKDGIEDIKLNIDHPTSSVNVNDAMEMIYQYSAEKVLSKTFELCLEHRNCSSVMLDKWNYIGRSYSFTSDHEITVEEGYYMIDCEEYERMERISKLRTIKRDSYTLKWNDSKGMFIKDHHL